jgi:2-polyprenyl-3-methyl-5-hydroxy-6-metoxy-1,4-benzoquinol methylase
MTAPMRTSDVWKCILCAERGRSLYGGLRDRLFAAPGVWSILQCPDATCGLLWLNPMPVPEDIGKAYETYYTHHVERPRGGALSGLLDAAKRGYIANRYGYEASLLERVAGLLPWIYPGRSSELDFSVMWLEAGRRGRLLDVGAGSGWLVEHMRSLGWAAEGVDFDPRAVERARSRGLNVALGGLREQRFGDESYDAVTMSHSIEHVHDPVAWLAEVRRVLKPGGRLALATPNTRSLLHRRFGEHWFALDPPRHLHLFNRVALDRVLRRAGFERFRLFTSVRDANGAFIGSSHIRKHGRHDMTGRLPAAERAIGRAAQLGEAARMLVDSDAGEDLVAVAER